MAKLTTKKIQAGTLIEVIIAMVIIMVVFGIALRIYGNVWYSSVSYQKIEAQAQLQVLAADVRDRGYVDQTSIEIDQISYHYFTDTTAISGVSKLEIQALQENKLLAEIHCLYHEQTHATEN